MSGPVWILIAYPLTVSGIIIIDSHEVECDEKLANLTTSYREDYDGNFLTNVTIQTFKSITKGFLYFNIKLAADQNDREYKFEIIKTVIDGEKFLKGAQSNPFLKPFIDGIIQSANLEIRFPLAAVSEAVCLIECNIHKNY